MSRLTHRPTLVVKKKEETDPVTQRESSEMKGQVTLLEKHAQYLMREEATYY